MTPATATRMPRLVLRELFFLGDLPDPGRNPSRAKLLRAMAAHDKALIDRWNAEHPDEPAIATEFEDAVIVWCDGGGDEGAIDRALLHSRGVKTLGETESSERSRRDET